MAQSSSQAFAPVEWLIAWRYLRARKSEGGVSAVSLIALIGVALGVAAMIVTFAVREGFRAEYVRTILGNEAHAQIVPVGLVEIDGAALPGLPHYDRLVEIVEEMDGVTSASPVVARQLVITANQTTNFIEALGVDPEELNNNTRLQEKSFGDISAFKAGEYTIAIGQGLAWSLGVDIGDKVVLVDVQGADTAFGTVPRENAYEVVYIVNSGNDFVDRGRVYLPFDIAQSTFDLEGVASRVDIMVEDAENIEAYRGEIESKLNGRALMVDWRERNANVFDSLRSEDNVMYILMTVLVIVSCFTIAAGLIMLVKNKTSDIAILRTMGFSRGRVMRIFFIAGVSLSLIGMIIGVIIAALFCHFFDPIFIFFSWIFGGFDSMWAFQVIDRLDAVWNWRTVFYTCLLTLFVSILITIWPASTAARLDPVEALRNG